MYKGTASSVFFLCWDPTADSGKGAAVSGQAANIAVEVAKDTGALAVSTNSVAELGSTGIYRLNLATTESNAGVVALRAYHTGGTYKVLPELTTVYTRDPVSVSITPLTATAVSSIPVDEDVVIAQGSSGPSQQWTVTDENDVPVNLAGKKVRLVLFGVTDGKLKAQWATTEASPKLTITGASNNIVQFAFEATDTALPVIYRYVLWQLDEPTGQDLVLATGNWTVRDFVKGTV